MKLMKMMMLVMLMLGNAESGEFEGNGGSGVREGDTFFLFDLWEEGLHRHVFFNEDVTPVEMIQERINRKFFHPLITNEVKEKIVLKLSEIYRRSPLTAQIMLRGFELFRWGFAPRNLRETDLPSDETDIDLTDVELINLAVRRGRSISLNNKFWDGVGPVPDLDINNKVALMFHEIIYAFNPNQKRYARKFTSYLFSRAFSDYNYSQDDFLMWSHRMTIPVSFENGEYQELARRLRGARLYTVDYEPKVELRLYQPGIIDFKETIYKGDQIPQLAISEYCSLAKDLSHRGIDVGTMSVSVPTGFSYSVYFRSNKYQDKIFGVEDQTLYWSRIERVPHENDSRLYVERHNGSHPEHRRNFYTTNLDTAIWTDCEGHISRIVRRMLDSI